MNEEFENQETNEQQMADQETYTQQSSAKYSNTYGTYNTYEMPESEKARRKRERIERKTARQLEKSSRPKKNWAGRIAIGITSAVVLGAVAGATFFGVNYAGNLIFPAISSTSGTSTASSSKESEEDVSTVSSTVVSQTINTTVYDVSDMVDSVINSVVSISGTSVTSVNTFFGTQKYQSTISGSGFIIGTTEKELLIVTNAHVVEDLESLYVSFYDGTKLEAYIKGTKTDSDLAVIAVLLSDIPSDATYSIATIGDSSSIKVGDAAIVIGNSAGYGISVTAGVISATGKSVTKDEVVYSDLLQTDAAINPGNSGGAVFNANGEVIGISSLKLVDTSYEGMGYAISISSVMDIIEDLSLQEAKKEYSDDERGYLGINGITITSDISNTYGYPVGVAISYVASGLSADVAGLVKNDIIVSLDGITVTSYDDLIETLAYYLPGDTLEVEYYHMDDGDYVLKTTTVTLCSKSDVSSASSGGKR